MDRVLELLFHGGLGVLLGIVGTLVFRRWRQTKHPSANSIAAHTAHVPYRSMVERSFHGIIIHQDGVIRFVNQALADLFGYTSPQELVGRNYWETLVDAAMWPELQPRTAAVMRGEPVPLHHGWQGIRQDGSHLWIESTASPIQWQQQPAVLAFFVDISEQKHTKDASAEQSTRFQTLTRLNQVISSSLDMATVLHAIAQAAAKLMEAPVVSFWIADTATQTMDVGAFSDEIIGADFPARHVRFDQGGVGWVARHHCALNVDNVFQDARFIAGDWWKRHQLRSFYCAPVIYEDKLLALLALNGRQPFRFGEVEQELLETFVSQAAIAIRNASLYTEIAQARDAAEAGSRAKSEFLANMSHEIRTPMNGALGMIELLRNTALTDKQQHFASTAYQSAEVLSGILNDILDFSKIEAGKLQLEVIDFNVRQVLEEVMAIVAETAQKKGLRLTCEIAVEVPLMLAGDPMRLRQILTNLLSNAVKFTVQGSVDVRVEVLANETGQTQLYFAVADTGIGISPEAQTRIFQAFTQADGSTTRQYGGSGLGLAIARQLTALMGGEIGVESVQEHGATFWFTTCFASATQKVPAVSAAVSPLHHPTSLASHLLLAEDNPVNQEVARAMLEQLGCQVTLVSNGRAALEAARHTRYDAVLMDCQMPEMDGFATTRALRQQGIVGTAGPLPIIALTANALAGDRERCLAAGMNDYLSKPFSREQLQATLERCLAAPTLASAPSASADETTSPLPTQAMPAPPVIAPQALDELRAIQQQSGKNIIGKMLNMYLTQTPDMLKNLCDAQQQDDAATLHRLAHTLKSSSAYVGALHFSTLCRELEAIGKHYDRIQAAMVLEALQEEYPKVQSALAGELQKEHLTGETSKGSATHGVDGYTGASSVAIPSDS